MPRGKYLPDGEGFVKDRLDDSSEHVFTNKLGRKMSAPWTPTNFTPEQKKMWRAYWEQQVSLWCDEVRQSKRDNWNDMRRRH